MLPKQCLLKARLIIVQSMIKNRIEMEYYKNLRINKLLDAMGSAAPAFGMMGTVIGLVVVLSNISNPSELGEGLSLSLITTLYGVLVARIVCFPLAVKVKNINVRTRLYRYFLLEALERISSGNSSVQIEQYLNSYFR